MVPSPKVILTVFAGRKRFLSVLITYIHTLVKHKVIDEAHLWDYCRTDPDRAYLNTLQHSAVHIMTTSGADRNAKFPHKWKGYYAYYAKNIGADDLLLKCDDDVVFISNLQPLLDFARADHAGRYLIYYPSIVNNDVAASFQACAACFPLICLQGRSGNTAKQPMPWWKGCCCCCCALRLLMASSRTQSMCCRCAPPRSTAHTHVDRFQTGAALPTAACKSRKHYNLETTVIAECSQCAAGKR